VKPISWEMKLGILLIAFSIVVYTIKFAVLGNPENTYYYLFNALGFLPINVFLVTIVLNKLLMIRSRLDKLEKLNMVIGTFFSEVGTELLTLLSDADQHLDEIRGMLVVGSDWTDEDYARSEAQLKGHEYAIGIASIHLEQLRKFLHERRDFMLRMLENPVLLEHETFTDLLRAVFHLAEELDRRGDFTNLPEADLKHLAGDINRVYGQLVHLWLDYMRHLQRNYPYLFSLALRTNPFDESATPVVQST
jgi:hypothetical protein